MPWRTRVPASSSFFFFCAVSNAAQARATARIRKALGRRNCTIIPLLFFLVKLVFVVFVLVFFLVVFVEVLIVLVVIVLVFGVGSEFKRSNAADAQISAALFARQRIAFIEFFFVHVHRFVAERTIDHSILLGASATRIRWELSSNVRYIFTTLVCDQEMPPGSHATCKIPAEARRSSGVRVITVFSKSSAASIT